MDQRPLAIFDLDGTLVRGDTLLHFLVSYARRRRRFWPVVRLPFDLGLYATRLVSDRTTKDRVLRRFLCGEPIERLAEHARWFCENWLPGRWKPTVVAELRKHQEQGRRVVLLSASPDVYVPAIGSVLGVHDVICTRVAVSAGICSGSIVGDNCKGPAKLGALLAHLNGAGVPRDSFAYGDSRSDLPVLQAVEHGYLCDRRGNLTPVTSDLQKRGN